MYYSNIPPGTTAADIHRHNDPNGDRCFDCGRVLDPYETVEIEDIKFGTFCVCDDDARKRIEKDRKREAA